MDKKERKFARSLTGPGSAARVRETVSVAVRENSSLTKPKYVEPLDYETVVVKNKTVLSNDPQREMLLFPYDDVSQSTLPRRFRTTRSSVPPSAIRDASSLLVKECIKSYTASWSVIHYKYSGYSGSYLQIPKLGETAGHPEALPSQVFEVDAMADGKEEESLSSKQKNQHIKTGWLFKGPDSGQEASIISFTRSFKRRFFYLKQQADTTYILEFHKDDRKIEPKGAIFLDSAIDVTKCPKRGKNTFQIAMQDSGVYLLAAETEGDLEDWVGTLRKVITATVTRHKQDERARDKEPPAVLRETFQESLEHSMNPELQKYARETDSSLAQQRKENRQKLFALYPELKKSKPPDLGEEHSDPEVYKEVFGKRFMVKCEGFTTRLQANLGDDGQTEKLSNPEPFFISLSLYDARAKQKISEDFHYDPNSPLIRAMVPKDLLYALDMLNGTAGGATGSKVNDPNLHGLDADWVAFNKLAVFSVTDPHPDIFLVARIEKVLQGSVSTATEPYVRNPDTRVGSKVHRAMKTYCSRLGHYRMPFAWAVKTVFKPFSGELDMHSDFVLYRADSTRYTEEELLKQLGDLKKSDKQSRLQTIHGKLTINLFQFKATTNTVTSALVPLHPFPDPPAHEPTVEVEEFCPSAGRHASPHTAYTNHLYVYPRALKYDGQKAFPKARNIAVSVEFRESDEEGAVPLKLIRGRPGGPIFTSASSATVLHHNTTPSFMEEVKILLPTQLRDKHHLLFKFYHVSCDLSKSSSSAKRVHGTEVPVGYGWLPLTTNGRVNVGDQQIKIAMTLTPGYLGNENLGLNKGSVGPEVRWVDTKPLFTFSLRLASTVYTKDQHLHTFFSHCQRLKQNPTAGLDVDTSNKLKHDTNYVHRLTSYFERDAASAIMQQDIEKSPSQGQGRRPAPDPMCGVIQGLMAVPVGTVIEFLPTLFNQLFRLLPSTNSEDVALNTVRVLTHMAAEIHKVKGHDKDGNLQDKPEILQTYVKYVFVTEPAVHGRDRTVHEELAVHLNSLMRPAKTDHLDIVTLLNHLWFFFDVVVKSMAQHLLSTGRIKMARNERFPSSFAFTIQSLVISITTQIIQKYREKLSQTRNANISLANFIKRCFTYMDRGFVFKLINLYIEKFSPGDPKILHEFKFDFLCIVCNHEHYIPLNLPLMRKQVKNYKEIRPEDLKHDYTLSDEFRKNHFLVGLLLHELRLALNEIKDIRRYAIRTLRNLLAKHAFDDRYTSKSQQARIANLYLPFLTTILENKTRLAVRDSLAPSPTVTNGDDRPSLTSYSSSVSLDTTASSTATLASNSSLTRNVRDPAVFALISGPGAASTGNLSAGLSELTLNGSSLSLESSASDQSSATEKGSDSREGSILRSHSRQGSLCGPFPSSASQAGSQFVVRYDKLDHKEIKDLLLCFLYVVDNLAEEVLLGWFNNSSEYDILDFFTILETCMQQFKYLGRKRITSLCIISDSSTRHVGASGSLPSTTGGKKPSLLNYNRASSAYGDGIRNSIAHGSPSEADAVFQAVMEANLSSEVATTVLDVITLYTASFKDQLHFREGDNPVMAKVFDLYLSFLQTSQSEGVQRHAFGALRSFINKFAKVLFVGDAAMCGRLCYEILRCCNSRLKSTRSEACALLYLLMRSNFEFCQRKSFTRVHLQIIVAVSELINDVVGLSNSRAFTDSLSIINSFAHQDKAMQRLAFPSEVNDLTKRVRTVLMATAQMKEHQNDPEMLVDLQYCLAKSYTSTPELRKTWLQNMAKKHRDNKDYSEAAHCYIHIAALVAEYLKRRGKLGREFPPGCSAFRRISANVEAEEAGMKDDSGMQDVDYTEDKLTSLLEECASLFEQAERYEILGDIYRLIIPIYERRRDFTSLEQAYATLHRSYKKIVEVMVSGKRLLGSYFRVACYGQSYFEDEDGKEYIYKEPKVTSLTEICDRLKALYSAKFGADNVRLIRDSNKVNPSDLDSRLAYIQVTHVRPYYDAKELEERVTDFERNNNVRRFMYETPFTQSGRAHGEVADQWKRRTILTTVNSFPYVKKRIQVVYHKDESLSPIEVAIDEMTHKVAELDDVTTTQVPDVKRLQLKLAGSVSAQVNSGPLAYAEAFLEKSNIHKNDILKVENLKDVFRDFLQVCDRALKLNQRLIQTDQIEYHESLATNHREMAEKLGEMFGEQDLSTNI